MIEEEWEQKNLQGGSCWIAALERVMYFGGLATVLNLHNALIYLRTQSRPHGKANAYDCIRRERTEF
jgi:hypothetical protein